MDLQKQQDKRSRDIFDEYVLRAFEHGEDEVYFSLYEELDIVTNPLYSEFETFREWFHNKDNASYINTSISKNKESTLIRSKKMDKLREGWLNTVEPKAFTHKSTSTYIGMYDYE